MPPKKVLRIVALPAVLVSPNSIRPALTIVALPAELLPAKLIMPLKVLAMFALPAVLLSRNSRL